MNNINQSSNSELIIKTDRAAKIATLRRNGYSSDRLAALEGVGPLPDVPDDIIETSATVDPDTIGLTSNNLPQSPIGFVSESFGS